MVSGGPHKALQQCTVGSIPTIPTILYEDLFFKNDFRIIVKKLIDKSDRSNQPVKICGSGGMVDAPA